MGSKPGPSWWQVGVLAFFVGAVATVHGQIGMVGEGELPELITTPGPKRIRLVDPASRDLYFPINVNNWWGMMNQRGDLVVYPFYDWTDYPYDGLARVIENGLTGFQQTGGNWYIQPVFPFADRFSEGYAVVGNGEKFGFINRAGQMITGFDFDQALRFHEGLAAVMINGRSGFIDVRGRLVIDPVYPEVRSFHQGVAMFRLPGRVDPDGQDGARLPGPIGYMNRTGRHMFLDRTGAIEEAGDFHDNLARFKINGKWGYLNRSYRVSIAPQFDEARDFHNRLAAVRVGDRWGYIDRSGRMAIAPQYEEGWDYRDDRSLMVRSEGQYGFVNRVGGWLIPAQYAWAEPVQERLARVASDHGFNYVGLTGQVIWDTTMALRGFVDMRISERARIRYTETDQYNRITVIPPWRPPAVDPYLPEYLYEPVLPQPPAQFALPVQPAVQP